MMGIREFDEQTLIVAFVNGRASLTYCGARRALRLYCTDMRVMQLKDDEPLRREEPTLRDLVAILWRGKFLVLMLTAAATVGAVGVAWLMPKQYQASVLISPSTNSSNSSQLGGLGGLSSSLGGLASLAGVSLSGDPKKYESLAFLQSDEITERYIRMHGLLPVIYKKKWDAESSRWTVSDPKKIPTVWMANKYFKTHIRSLTTDAKTGISTLTIKWTDPALAATWANDLVKMTNNYMRNEAIAESERNIGYLNEQASKTDFLGAKQAIYALLQSEINKLMLARGNEAFALKIIDPAEQPEEHSSPKMLNWLLGGFFGGLLASLFIVFARAKWQLSTGALHGSWSPNDESPQNH